MSSTVTFVKTLVGGLLFTMPIGIIVVVVGRLLSVIRKAGEPAHDRLFPGAASQVSPLLLATTILPLIAMAAGLVARSPAGIEMFVRIKGLVLARFSAPCSAK
jgi:hypothetical protein